MALIEKETLLKGLWDVVLIGVSGTVCVVGSYFVVTRAVAKAAAQIGPAGSAAPLTPVNFADPHQPQPPAGHDEMALNPSGEGHGESKKEGKEKKKKKKAAEGENGEGGGLTYPLRTTVVNLAPDSNHRFAKVSITLEADSKGAAEELKVVDHQIYDCLIDTLGNVRAQDIGSDAGKDMLKETLRQKMNKFMTEGEISNVYMTEFLVQ
ncbi:MAG: flagellar basal body-associated FliL family protein [Elusimicrobia bacterium]|nr:flagellar basal body-associated FliL family protein [Elusimicrobiota bacterium]